MSIIYDALKKVEVSLQKPAEETSQQARQPPKIKHYLIYAFILCLGLFFGNLIFKLIKFNMRSGVADIGDKAADTRNLNTPTENSPAIVAEKTPLPKEEINPEPAAAAISSESFVLNGIFYSNNEGYALINNQVVRVGDTIGGASVKQISPEEVELEAQGTVVKLIAK